MKRQFWKAAFICALACTAGISASAQQTKAKSDRNALTSASATVGVILVKSAAKAAWKTTKFVAKDVARPAAVSILKPFVLRVVPQAAKLGLRYGGTAAKNLLPHAWKVALL